mgnify:CR=1 FL=1
MSHHKNNAESSNRKLTKHSSKLNIKLQDNDQISYKMTAVTQHERTT